MSLCAYLGYARFGVSVALRCEWNFFLLFLPPPVLLSSLLLSFHHATPLTSSTTPRQDHIDFFNERLTSAQARYEASTGNSQTAWDAPQVVMREGAMGEEGMRVRICRRSFHTQGFVPGVCVYGGSTPAACPPGVINSPHVWCQKTVCRIGIAEYAAPGMRT